GGDVWIIALGDLILCYGGRPAPRPLGVDAGRPPGVNFPTFFFFKGGERVFWYIFLFCFLFFFLFPTFACLLCGRARFLWSAGVVHGCRGYDGHGGGAALDRRLAAAAFRLDGCFLARTHGDGGQCDRFTAAFGFLLGAAFLLGLGRAGG